ncbi:MAG: hypothetical protein JWO63_1664 [Frankiales bacterium]|nr:hypothetical protein [Frankiales bacterium]
MTDSMAVYRRVVDHFTELVDSIAADRWDAPTPCEGWTVRDLIEHILVRDRRLAATVGDSDSAPSGGDLAAQWHERVDWWAQGLADPERSAVVWSTPLGELSFAQAAAAMTTGELTIHTWDLARALGVDEQLDPEAVQLTFESMQRHAAALRGPGVFGPELPHDAGGSEQERLLAFTGRQV